MDRVSIYQRKANIYQALSKLIADPAKRHTTTTISVLAAAPIAEARFGEPELGRKHCVALLHLLNAQGGHQALRKMTTSAGIATRIMVSLISIGAGYAAFANYATLLTSLASLKETLLAMQTWHELTSLSTSTGRKLVWRKRSVGEKQNDQASPSFAGDHYRIKHFDPKSPLYRYVGPTVDGDSLVEQRCHFASLFIFNKVILDLRNDTEECKRFFNEMVDAINSGQVRPEESKTEPLIRMKTLTVLYIVADCATRYESGDKVPRSWQAIDALELVQLASESGRLRVTGLLSGWLTGGGVLYQLLP